MNQSTDRTESQADDRTHHVDPCPRCGTDHGEQPFRRLVRPMRFGGARFGWWWTCTTTGEPVLADIPLEEDA